MTELAMHVAKEGSEIVAEPDRPRVLLIVTGGIAAYKACDVVRELRRRDAEVQVAMTSSAKQFVTPLTFEALSAHRVWSELLPGCHDGSIDHIELGRWADRVAVVPATADYLAKVRAGFADDLTLATMLALPAATPILFAPSMNVEMWQHPVTQRNLRELQELGAQRYTFLEPVEKELACGEIGQGGLPEPVVIATAILELR